MEIIRLINDMQVRSRQWRQEGKTIALVPTMGHLHRGHVSLIEIARKKADIVVVSIFVNPSQFGVNEDFADYPRDFASDQKLCSDAGAAAIFAPPTAEMYASDFSTWVSEDKLSQPLCGRSRPGHFRGVTTVVAKLFLAVLPDVAVFGQKDAQQVLVVKRMIRDLNFPINIIVGPVVREENGLAMSSRNDYLDPDQRNAAAAVNRGLRRCQIEFNAGERQAENLIQILRSKITSSGGIVDYVECVDFDTLDAVGTIAADVLLAVAANYGRARIIDNCFLSIDSDILPQ